MSVVVVVDDERRGVGAIVGVSSVPSTASQVVVTRAGGVVEVVSAHERNRQENRWAAAARQPLALRIAAVEHVKAKLFVAVRGDRDLVWWSKTAASLSEAQSFSLDGGRIVQVMSTRKLEEVVVVDDVGRVHLFHPALHSVTSMVGSSDGELTTVWSGLYSIAKVLHVLLLVCNRAAHTHHLRVIRLSASAKEAMPVQQRFDEPEAKSVDKLHQLEHVCAHLLVAPPQAVGSTPRIVEACFDEAVLRLSVVWDQGCLAAYDFVKGRQLASLSPPPPAIARPAWLHLGAATVQRGVKLCAYRAELVCVVWAEEAGRVRLAVINTAYGVVPVTPLTVCSEGEHVDETTRVVSFVAASNEQFFLVATKSVLYRCVVEAPASCFVRDCLAAQTLTDELFGRQERVWRAEQESLEFVFVEGKLLDQAPKKKKRANRSYKKTEKRVQVGLAEELRFLSATPVPRHTKVWNEFMVQRLVPGTGHAQGDTPLTVAKRADRYTLSVEFGQGALALAARERLWQTCVSLLRARICDVPPAGFLEAALEAERIDVLVALAESSFGLEHKHVASLLAFAVQKGSDQLFETVVGWQECTCDDLMRRSLSAVDTAVAQAMFAKLVRLLGSPSLAVRPSAAVEWLCCLLDAHPNTFELDPAMQRGVQDLTKVVDAELKVAKKVAELKYVLEVLRYQLLDPPADAACDYAIEIVLLR